MTLLAMCVAVTAYALLQTMLVPALTMGPTWPALGLLVVAVVSFALLLRIERRVASPLIDVALVPTLAGRSLGASQFVLYVLLPRLVETS